MYMYMKRACKRVCHHMCMYMWTYMCTRMTLWLHACMHLHICVCETVRRFKHCVGTSLNLCSVVESYPGRPFESCVLLNLIEAPTVPSPSPLVWFVQWGFQVSLKAVNDMMLNQMDTNDDDFDVACHWLLSNEDRWTTWLPEKGKCFSQFGMYSVPCQIPMKSFIAVLRWLEE